MRRLLGLVCDACVDLDTNLRITDDAPAFAAMVTLDASRRFKGSVFTEFFAREDKDTIREQLQAAQQPGDLQPSALHSSLLDSMGNRVGVDVIFVPFEASDGRKQLVVGVREVGTRELKDLNTLPKTKKKLKARRRRGRPGSADGLATTIGRGTRSDLEPLPLDSPCCSLASPPSEDDACRNSSSSSNRSRQPRLWMLMRPELARTQDEAVQISLVNVMRKWNREVRGKICCPFHASVIEASCGLEALRRSPCKSDWKPGFGDWQCDFCGALGDALEADVCNVCEEGELKRCHVNPKGDVQMRVQL